MARKKTWTELESVIDSLVNRVRLMVEQPNAAYGGDIRTVIAVSGAAALGKSHLCERLVGRLNELDISAEHVELDGYLAEREERKRSGRSGYDPLSSNLSQMAEDLRLLVKQGKTTELPTYEHRTGKHGESKRVGPQCVMVLDGIMSMHYEIRRQFSDFGVFLHAQELTMRSLRLHTDVTRRGYSVHRALRQADTETLNYNQWIHHQIAYADATIEIAVPEEAMEAKEDTAEEVADEEKAALVLGKRLFKPLLREYYLDTARQTKSSKAKASSPGQEEWVQSSSDLAKKRKHGAPYWSILKVGKAILGVPISRRCSVVQAPIHTSTHSMIDAVIAHHMLQSNRVVVQ